MEILDFMKSVKLRCNCCEGLNFFSAKKQFTKFLSPSLRKTQGAKVGINRAFRQGRSQHWQWGENSVCFLSPKYICEYILAAKGWLENIAHPLLIGSMKVPTFNNSWGQSYYLGHTGYAKSESWINSQFFFAFSNGYCTVVKTRHKVISNGLSCSISDFFWNILCKKWSWRLDS